MKATKLRDCEKLLFLLVIHTSIRVMLTPEDTYGNREAKRS